MLVEKKLRKHVAIIHAYSMMSVLQRKIVNVLLYEAIKNKNDNNDQNSVVIERLFHFSKLSRLVNFNSNNTQYLKKAIDGLASLKIEWNLLKDRAPTNISFLNLRILHGSPTFYKDGTFNFSFHKFMLDLVDSPSIYGTIDVDIQSKFESKYGHSLYENSTRFLHLKKSKIIPLDTFRKILGVHEKKYKSMRELTRNVVKTSLEEVNDRAAFVVNIENIRLGRKVAGFEIFVQRKSKIFSSNERYECVKQGKIFGAIEQAFGKINESVLENILRSYSEEYILEKIAYTRKHAKKEKTGFYPTAYFISALRYDYRSSKQFIVENRGQVIFDNKGNKWKEKLCALQSDLEHWRNHLKHAQSNDNFLQFESIKKIVLQCEEQLQNHLLKQPKNMMKREAF